MVVQAAHFGLGCKLDHSDMLFGKTTHRSRRGRAWFNGRKLARRGGESRCGGSGNINKGSTACGSSVNKDDIKNEVSDNNNSSGSANGRRHGEASM